MCPIAKRWCLRGLAAAPSHRFLFSNLDDFGGHANGAMRTIAKRLFMRFAARTPGINFRLSIQDIGLIADGIFFRHAINYNERWVPSQKGGLCECLQPHQAIFCFVSTFKLRGRNKVVRCEPSQ